MAKSFRRVASESVLRTPIFGLRRDTVAHPDTDQPADVFVLESPGWVNVVPETPDGRIVMVRQWRHGSRSLELEVPAGLIDPGETPLEAGPRELREETGYASDRWTTIGQMLPNPAYQDNVCTTLLAEDCRWVGEPQPDPDESIEVVLAEAAEVRDLVRSGELRNSVALCAVLWWLDHRGRIEWP